MTSERFEKMFKCDSEDTCGENFRLCRWGDERKRQACADREQGPPLAQVEIFDIVPRNCLKKNGQIELLQKLGYQLMLKYL